jgi:hypothetical protein
MESAMSERKVSLDIGVEVLIVKSSIPDNPYFGTGFVIHQDADSTFVLTCAHVVEDVGGKDRILVNGYKANLVSMGNDEDDLAILKIKRTKTYLTKPLASYDPFLDSGNLNISFGITGFSEKIKGSYSTQEVEGKLGALVNMTTGYQHEPTKAWELYVNDEKVLKPGYSGSPVVNKIHRIILGVVRFREGEGKSGLAISIEALSNIWNNDLSNLLRDNIYNLDEIAKLTFSVFHEDEEGFSEFYRTHFRDQFRDDLTFYAQIAYLVLSCHYLNLIDNLLSTINNAHPEIFQKYAHKIYVKKSIYNARVFKARKKAENEIFCKRIKAVLKDINGNLFKKVDSDRSQVEITYRFDGRLGLDPQSLNQVELLVIDAFVTATAIALDISRSSLEVLAVKTGSIKVQIRLSSKKVDEIIHLYESDRNLMHKLGISYVTEVLERPFYIEHIESLLDQGFSMSELMELCEEQLNTIPSEIISIEDKKTFIRELLRYFSMESSISELLSILERSKPEQYVKYSPYIKIPRRPFQEEIRQGDQRNRSRRTSQNINWRQFARVGIKAASISFLCSIGIFILYLVVSQLNDILAGVIFISFPYLGNYIGEVVSRNLNYQGSRSAARLSVISFLSGALIMPLLAATYIFFLFYTGNSFRAFLYTLASIPVFFYCRGSSLYHYVAKPYAVSRLFTETHNRW